MTSEPPKFLVDEMLQRLGRWLRAAGYDTIVAGHATPDYYLLRQAIDENRLLLTCDRKLMEHRRAVSRVILLTCRSLEETVQELTRQLHIDWQLNPFSRCLVCNSLLLDALPAHMKHAPASIHKRDMPALYCPKCNQVYWEGSHVKRMRHQLLSWHRTLA